MLRKTCSSQRFAHSMSYSAPDGGIDVDEPPRTHRCARRRASMPLMTTNAGTTYGEPEPQVKSPSCLLDPEMPVRRSPCLKRRKSFWSHQGTSLTVSSGHASVAAGTTISERTRSQNSRDAVLFWSHELPSMPTSMPYTVYVLKPRPLDTSLLSPNSNGIIRRLVSDMR